MRHRVPVIGNHTCSRRVDWIMGNEMEYLTNEYKDQKKDCAGGEQAEQSEP